MNNIYIEQAIGPFVNQLFGMGDIDETLTRIGKTRVDLRALEGDDEITAACDTRREALIATPWRLEPGKGRSVTFIYNEIEKHIVDIIKNAWSAICYGYDVQEVIYKKYDTGRIGIDNVNDKPFEWFRISRDGELFYISPKNYMGELVDTDFKFLLTRHRNSFRLPMGEPLYARLYWPWFFRTHGWKFWAKWLERFGTPFLLGKTDFNAQAFSDALVQASSDSTLTIATADDVQILGANMGTAHFEAFESAILKRIQRLILGQTLTSDIGDKGSYAAASVHNEVRDDRRKADIRMVSKIIQTLVNALHVLNGFSGDPPIFVMQDDTGLEEARANRDAVLVNAGILQLTPEYLIRVYDYEENDFVLPQNTNTNVDPLAVNQPNQVTQDAQKQLGFHAFSSVDNATFTPEQQVIEGIADKLIEHLNSPIKPELIASAIRSAKNPEDLEQRLSIILKDADFSEFSGVLEKALFAADVLGYAHAG